MAGAATSRLRIWEWQASLPSVNVGPVVFLPGGMETEQLKADVEIEAWELLEPRILNLEEDVVQTSGM
jgi:hypothetical protein